MKWKSKMAVTVVLALAAVAVSVSAFATGSSREAEVSPIYATVAEVEDTGEGYIVREYNGYIAVYSEDAPDRPSVVTDIEVSQLREVDQELLKSGIRVLDREELLLLLEDLGS